MNRHTLAGVGCVLLLVGCNLFSPVRYPCTTAPGADTGLDATVSDASSDVSSGSDGSVSPPDTSTSDMSQPPTDLGTDVDLGCAVSDSDFCLAQGKNCGIVSGVDDCGMMRQVNCGTCNTTCGTMEANVCGCPCDIAGDCRVAGERNPDNYCEICDPSQDDQGWSIDEGAACDDGDACTGTSTCDATGACVPPDGQGCAATAPECMVGACDQATATCEYTMASDGAPCTDDGLSCTDNSCVSGTCTTTQLPSTCLINGVCYADGDPNPANGCQKCDSASDPTGWTLAPGATCDDGDGLGCTSGVCDNSGTCQAMLVAGSCLISGACYVDGDPDPANACQICDSTSRTGAWSIAMGASCDDGDGLGCTSGQCDANAVCQPMLDAASCLIGNTCYGGGDLNPANDCQACDPGSTQSDWSNVADTTACSAGLTCASGTCAAGTCNITTIDASSCLISNTCYPSGHLDPARYCYSCQPSTSQTDWSVRSNGVSCSGAGGCSCNAGQCEKNNGMICP